jgi:ubiquinone/menaquinone biosynthesis C-methylase UbiE
MALHHVDSPPEALKEMSRILKPGGKVVITDLDEHDYESYELNTTTYGWALSELISRGGSLRWVR